MISEQLAEIDAKFSSESKDIKKVHEEAKSATDGFQVKINYFSLCIIDSFLVSADIKMNKIVI